MDGCTNLSEIGQADCLSGRDGGPAGSEGRSKDSSRISIPISRSNSSRQRKAYRRVMDKSPPHPDPFTASPATYPSKRSNPLNPQSRPLSNQTPRRSLETIQKTTRQNPPDSQYHLRSNPAKKHVKHPDIVQIPISHFTKRRTDVALPARVCRLNRRQIKPRKVQQVIGNNLRTKLRVVINSLASALYKSRCSDNRPAPLHAADTASTGRHPPEANNCAA